MVGAGYPALSTFALKGNLKELMATIIVTETYLLVYELEVPDTDEPTITDAIDAYRLTNDDKPEWAGTCITDEAGDELMDW